MFYYLGAGLQDNMFYQILKTIANYGKKWGLAKHNVNL
jgi:hypothetical protein